MDNTTYKYFLNQKSSKLKIKKMKYEEWKETMQKLIIDRFNKENTLKNIKKKRKFNEIS